MTNIETDTICNAYDRCFDEDVEHAARGCPECDGRVTTNTRETVCDDCGLVLADQPIDHGPEWRQFESEGEPDRSRVGQPLSPTQHDQGLATEIGTHVDGQGRQLRGAARRRAYRLRRGQTRMIRGRSSDRNRLYGNFEIGRLCSGLELSFSLRQQACALFATAQTAGLLRGRSVEAIAAACVYTVCRLDERPITQAEVETFAHDSGTSVTSAYRTLNTELGLPIPPRGAQLFIARLLDELNLDDAVAVNIIRRVATELVDRHEREGFSNGRNPRGIAAAALYHVLSEAWPEVHVTQFEVATAAGVSEVTLRARWREIQTID
jgi:transcription initiation factor TFIIB